MKTRLIYFVHGTTYDNASKKCSGWEYDLKIDKI